MITGIAISYSDANGYGHPTIVHGDQAATQGVIKAVLGHTALAPKSVTPRPAGEIIGCSVDITLDDSSLAERVT